jgi:hypothetical protein
MRTNGRYCTGAKARVILHLLQRAVLAVRVDDQHGSAVVRHHQFFQQHAGQIALAAAGAGDDRQVGAGEALDIKRHRHCAGCAAEQAADVCAAALAGSALAEHIAQKLVFSDVDRRAAAGWHARVDEIAKHRVVIPQHRDSDFEKFAGVAVIAEQNSDLARRDGGIGHEAVGEELDRHAPGDTPEDAALLVVDRRLIIDELAVLELARRVGCDKGKFVRCFARAFDCPDADREFHGKLLRQKKTRVLSPEGRFWGRPQHTGNYDYTQPADSCKFRSARF